MFRKRSILSIILVLALLLSNSSVFAIENNAASKEEKTLLISYAYYNADQYMWKATLYVAKSDTWLQQKHLLWMTSTKLEQKVYTCLL